MNQRDGIYLTERGMRVVARLPSVRNMSWLEWGLAAAAVAMFAFMLFTLATTSTPF